MSRVQYTPEGFVTAKPRLSRMDSGWWVEGPDYCWGPGSFSEACGIACWEHQKYGPWLASKLQPYDSDHTALVHVLWAAERRGLTVKDADALAEHIMTSKWMRAVREHSRVRDASQAPGGQGRMSTTQENDLIGDR